MATKYRIEYGNSTYYKSAKDNKYRITNTLNREEVLKKLKQLNKKWEYTTVFIFEDGKWKAIG